MNTKIHFGHLCMVVGDGWVWLIRHRRHPPLFRP